MHSDNDETRTPVAVITGATSGLGLAIVNALLANGWKVHGIADQEPEETQLGFVPHDNWAFHQCDLQWLDEIGSVALDIVGDDPESFQLDVLVNCAGINHLCPFESFEFRNWERLMDINAKALAMTARIFLPWLANKAIPEEGGTILNIVSNAAHMPMTHSLAYNASKAAALMVTKQLAREIFKSHGVTVFSISPNKLAGTGMSRQIEEAVPALRGWTPEEAEAYQRNALPTGAETPPILVAEFIAFLLSKKARHFYLHGCDIPYGG